MAQVQSATTAAVPTGPVEDVRKGHHTHSNKLEDQAATAALYVTKYDNSKNGQEFLDSDHKLSFAGAAASLKYANPKDLPSYPSSGLKNDLAAGAAASLGWSNQKSFEHWKPDPSASASAAAVLAKDYKMAPSWQPQQSSHGTKAATLAHKNDGKVEIWKPEPTVWGNSAAAQAFKKFGAGQASPMIDYGYTDLGRQRSLMAATGAMSTSRKRAESTPQRPAKLETYPDENNAAKNALSAATSAHTKKRSSSNMTPEGGSVPFTTMSREMYTSHPPVAAEVDELNRQNSLHASAVAMAKQMYNIQQKQTGAASNTHAQSGASAAHGRKPSTSSTGDDVQPMRFNSLQEAAQKLAQERLVKLHDEHAQNREYRDYYGSTQPTSRLSIRGRTRRRASSDGGLDEDREQSNKIRAQMSLFSNNISQVDTNKRQQDRENLIAIAQRNVTKSLHGMDEKVFAETGKVAPSLLSEWEVKAHAAAQRKSDNRMENYGKVNIGGGKFINQSAVDLVASKNVQPVLDDINEKAEVRRIKEAEIKHEQETQKRKAQEQKAREKEQKEIYKKLRQQDKEEEKARKAEKKVARDQEKNANKRLSQRAGMTAVVASGREDKVAETGTDRAEAAVDNDNVDEAVAGTTATTKEEEKPARDEEKLVMKEHAQNAEAAPVVGLGPADEIAETGNERIQGSAGIRTSMEDQASLRMRETANAANADDAPPTSPTSTKEGGKVKNWLKTKFARRMSRPQKPSTAEKDSEKRGSFIGGAALIGASANNSTTSLGVKGSSVQDVALANTKTREETKSEPFEERVAGSSARRESSVSSVSSVSSIGREDEEFQEARDNFDEDLAPPPTFPAHKSSSPARCAKFTEEI
ncbi:putative Eisosome protein 1 [Amylocarpus encephaloides]|uniref:Eisosome protein 1 n=1 Tax=Amylocarpus encephaloides TaxID=45428 RepID=A0A9P7YJL1_9HELO|nr:putative Eisosome protein 1 [Amylocarpus encephaloides]